MASKPKVQPVENVAPESDNVTALPTTAAATEEELDAEEQEFRALRRDLPGVKGAGAAGIVAISVGKAPARNEFFRAHREFCPLIPIVDLEIGMERQFFAVTADMVEALNSIGITVSDHVLYLTVTAAGAVRIVPVRQASADGEQNEYNRTKEIGLIQSFDEWVRLFTTRRTAATKCSPRRPGASASHNGPISSRRRSSSWRSATRAA
jgi:hypothetical protein